MRLVYLGNHGVDYSTESHVARSLESLGHEVTRLQEGEVRAVDVPWRAKGHDLFLHTQTLGLAITGGTDEERVRMLNGLAHFGIPSVGFHLDKWFGLERETMVGNDPFFLVDYLFTADGGHDQDFARRGVRHHHWLPPAVFHEECVPGNEVRQYRSDVAFVGNWRGGYHAESTHRAELIAHLHQRWGRRLRCWPRGRAVRGKELRDLYASVKVVVGDSCLVPNAPRYWSDRIPETLGRGGFLLHPYVEGIEEHFTDGEHLRLWTAGDWDELDRLIAYYLAHPAERRRIAEQGRAHVLEHHTYRNRMETVLSIVVGEKVG